MADHKNPKYTNAHLIQTEAGRTGIVTCLRCGATLILNDDIDVLGLHDKWHDVWHSPRVGIPRREPRY